MKEEYRISFGLQYEAWELKIHLPDHLLFENEAQAHAKTSNRNIYAFLTEVGIFLIEKGCIEKIQASERHLYEFSVLKDSVYERIGPPLSPGDIDRLIDLKQLEAVVFSDKYMISEDDFRLIAEDLMVIFEEIAQRYQPVEITSGEVYSKLRGMKGFLFESLWYSVIRVR